MKIIPVYQWNEFRHYDAIFFTKDGIIVDQRTHSPLIKFLEASKKSGIVVTAIYLDQQTLIISCQVSTNSQFSSQFSIYPIKSFLGAVNDEIQGKIFRGIHWLTFNAQQQYCTKCSNQLHHVLDLTEKRCQSCGSSFFPNLAPAIMVLIQRNHQVLLARSAHFKPNVYSAIAGFVDLGESAEEAVHREVKEEVGVEISQLTYFGSQSWPFPNSFMIAFKAHYLSGELNIDPSEIEEANWFDSDHLPTLPVYPSIARKLIDSWRMGLLD